MCYLCSGFFTHDYEIILILHGWIFSVTRFVILSVFFLLFTVRIGRYHIAKYFIRHSKYFPREWIYFFEESYGPFRRERVASSRSNPMKRDFANTIQYDGNDICFNRNQHMQSQSNMVHSTDRAQHPQHPKRSQLNSGWQKKVKSKNIVVLNEKQRHVLEQVQNH